MFLFLFQRFHRARFLALVAQNALGGVFPLARFVVHLHIHRADFQAFTALDTFFFIAVDAKHGKVAHRLEENRDRTNIFTEGAVIFECDGENNAHNVIDQISDEEKHEHGVFVGFPEMEQQKNKDEGKGEYDVTDVADLLSRTLRLLVGQEVEDHGRPAAITTPPATKQQRTENFGNGIVQNARTYNPGKQIVPEAFNLHVLLADQSQKDEHVGTHTELHELTGVFLSRSHQPRTDTDAKSDVAEVEQEEQVACR